MDYSRCPIPNTHRRLAQAHRLWHQAHDAYADPDSFQANLNAVIEALRNVTFMLQSEKGAIPDFDKWYEPWRDRLKADQIMKWLQEARTTVVHVSDLETLSKARAVIHNNLDLVTSVLEVPASVPTEDIAALLAESAPVHFRNQNADLILSVERRWCDSALPDFELLDALAHAYSVLEEVVVEAHRRAGADYELIEHGAKMPFVPGHRRGCMVTTDEARTIRIKLSSGELLNVARTEVERDEPDPGELIERYGSPPNLPDDPNDVFAYAEFLLPVAKAVLERDGYHLRLVHLRTPSGWAIRMVRAEDRPDKYAILRALAQEAKALRATAVIDIAEAWLIPLRRTSSGMLVPGAGDRKETLVVNVLTADGRFRSYETLFDRDASGAVYLNDTHVSEGAPPTYMAPFCHVWGLPIPQAAEQGDN